MKHLEAALSRVFDVWAIAPDRERSATSQAISIRETLQLIQVRERHFKVTGFPADCVNVALHWHLFPKFDLVVSGINHGPNLGDDVHYSGTVGAARHAAVHGIPAIAVSYPEKSHTGDFRRPAEWLSTYIQKHLSDLKPGIVYNINYPREPEGAVDHPRVHYTEHGRRVYHDTYEEIEEGPSSSILRLKETIMGETGSDHSDFFALSVGAISITPLTIRTTDKEELELWKRRGPSGIG